ncbi:MAG: hypothetical protein ACPGVG_16795 [Mycobacterium sp.]
MNDQDIIAVPTLRRRLFHGGKSGLRVGDLIEPGYERQLHEGCPYCEARFKGEAVATSDGHLIDGPAQRPDRVYATTHRLYAKHYASLWGRGDLYRVTTDGLVEPSTEDSFDTVCAERLVVAGVLDRAVLLTWSERRRLWREWGEADAKFTAAEHQMRKADQ